MVLAKRSKMFRWSNPLSSKAGCWVALYSSFIPVKNVERKCINEEEKNTAEFAIIAPLNHRIFASELKTSKYT